MTGIFSDPLYVLAILCFNVFLSIWLEKNTKLKHLGAALLSIIITAITANLGMIPSSSNPSIIYSGIFNYIAPISIFFLLLGVNLHQLRKAGKPMIILFLVGSAGTCSGVMIADLLLGNNYAEFRAPIAGMITGTYTGGSINFNAVAIHYDMIKQGGLYAAVVAVDNIITALWMILTLSLPKIIGIKNEEEHKSVESNASEFDRTNLSIFSLAYLIFTGFITLLFSNWVQEASGIPSILILTTVALILAQFPKIQQIGAAKVLGLLLVYLFLAVVGAFCDISALKEAGSIAGITFLYLLIVVVVHGLLLFGIGRLLRFDVIMISIASQANIGGSSSALALAKSLGRDNLLLAAVLLGALGNAIGTYLGFFLASIK